MKYICIDDGAIAEIISGRQLQSIDFNEGAEFVKTLTGKVEAFKASGAMVMTANSDGLFLSTAGAWKQKKYLVIDCEESGLFASINSSDALTTLQKSFRFCAKYWSGSGAYNSSERMILGTTKTVIFPLGFSKSTGFRVALERDPDPKRLKPRDLAGNFILLYKSGFDGADSAAEVAPLANFKKAVDLLSYVYSSLPKKLAAAEAQKAAVAPRKLTEVMLSDSSPSTLEGAFLPLEHWLNRLTKQQRQFIFAAPGIAQRLIGAAGTGKTATLLIRSLVHCAAFERDRRNFRALFVTHSESTRESVLEILDAMDPDGFHRRNPDVEAVSLTVKTLASVCSDVLNQTISETEFVDRDAQDSKILQSLYIEQSLQQARSAEFKSHSPHMSEKFRDFVTWNAESELAPLFQHEISIQIKGRAGGSFDVYRECPPLKYGLPVVNDADKGYVYIVFRLYEEQLRSTGQFDTDDVVISAVGQLDTPIWRRRRGREGFDFLAIDEAHLFNINELQVFHFLTRSPGVTPISFAIDRAQAVGDRGWSSGYLGDGGVISSSADEISYSAVFRSSSDIVDFATSVLASGATLFADFSNTLSQSRSGLTADQEKLTQPIIYYDASDDGSMIEAAFRRATALQKLTNSSPWEILITSLSDRLASDIAQFARDNNKAVTVLDRRGDYSRVRDAEKSGHMIVGHADFVGGLEFNAVVIAGVDKGRVPLEASSTTAETRSFQKYIAHNRLYVAASRARLALELFGLAGRGPSDLLGGAMKSGLVTREKV